MNNELLFTVKYRPTVQKDLFHRVQVKKFKEWFDCLDTEFTSNLILFGKSGSGKTTMADIILKVCNIIRIDSDNLRSTESMNEIVNSINSSNNFLNYKKGYYKSTNKNKNKNIILIDNVDLCINTIKKFIERLKLNGQTIPIILISNTKKICDVFKNNKTDIKFTIIEIDSPNLTETIRLIKLICTKEKLKQITEENMKQLATYSNFNLTQILNTLFYYSSGRKIKFEKFIENIATIDKEYEPIEIIEKLLNPNNEKNKSSLDSYFSKITEPSMMQNLIFQNLNVIQSFHIKENTLDIIKDISDQMSYANVLSNKMTISDTSLNDDCIISGVLFPSKLVSSNFTYRQKYPNDLLDKMVNVKDTQKMTKPLKMNYSDIIDKVQFIKLYIQNEKYTELANFICEYNLYTLENQTFISRKNLTEKNIDFKPFYALIKFDISDTIKKISKTLDAELKCKVLENIKNKLEPDTEQLQTMIKKVSLNEIWKFGKK